MRVAQRAGLHTVLIPARNQKDLRDVPESARNALQFVFMDNADDAIRSALQVPAAGPEAPEFSLV